MNFFRGVDKLGPTSSELANGFVNWPVHKAPPANGRYAWFRSQINPTYPSWNQNTKYKIDDMVSHANATYMAILMITPGPTSQPPPQSTRWKKITNVPKDVTALGQNWRASTPGGLIATATTEMGAFDTKEYVYQVTYDDNDLRAYALNNDGSVNGVALNLQQANMGSYLLITDAITAQVLTLETFNVLALYHGIVNTKEVTFLTPIPRNKFTGWRKGGQEHKGNFKADFTTTVYP